MTSRSKRLEPRKTPIQERGHDTRQRLLDAAAQVFARHGYAAGTTNRIAEQAGTSVGSLYQYFPNKDAMLVALVRQHVTQGGVLISERLTAAHDMPLSEKLPLLVDAVLANHTDNPRLHQVLFEEAPRPPELLAELHELEESIVHAVEGMIRADAAVIVADPAMAARLVVLAVESLIHRYISTHHAKLDLESFRGELVAMLTSYLYGTNRGDPRPRNETGLSASAP